MNNKFNEVKALVFDLDGTLVDSMRDFSEVAQEVLTDFFGLSPSEARAAYRQTSGLPFRFQVQSIFPDHQNIEEAVQEFETRKVLDYDKAPFFNDVLPVLESLAQEFVLFVSSNNHQANVEEKISQLPISFKRILGYQPGFLKGKDHFDCIQSEYGFAPSQILFIGDSLHDAKMAKENKINFAAKIGTFERSDFNEHHPDVIALENLSELLTLLRAQAANQNQSADRQKRFA
ncbi:MAG: HAD family hydrolase [Deltaproteobacteria bacterium]|nr:HAD family hydrolase [Deltaproteobacteria bacterium]